MKFRLGLDLDGVITRHPDHLRWLADHILMSGGEVHVITGRMEKERTRTLKELKGLHFRFTELHCYPGEYIYKGEALTVADMEDIGLWKANLCIDLAINLYMDDNHHYYQNGFEVPCVHI